MTAWAILRRPGTGAALVALLLIVSPATAQDTAAPAKAKPTAAELRATAATAEKAGDWEAAFAAYCHLFVADRSPDVREKLNVALRRAQQLRRHRDSQFQQYASTTTVSSALDLFAEVFTKVPVLYADRERATPQRLWEHGIDELDRALGSPAFVRAFLDNPTAAAIDRFRTGLRFRASQSVNDARAARVALGKLIIDAKDVFTVRVPSALVIEVVCGACSGLDEYTVFLTPAQSNPDSPSATADLTAHGVYLTVADGKLTVAGIAPGSWAAHHTRLQKGDAITSVNGQPMIDGVTQAFVAEALRAALDNTHVLELAPPDPDTPPGVVSLPVNVPTVYGIAMKPAKDGTHVGYLRIGSFGPTTPRELDDAISLLKSTHGARTFVIDLRGNMGGSFLAAVNTAKRLIPAGLIVTTQGQAAEVDNVAYPSDSGMTAHDVPVVILVDAETASAAEVLAAALKDHNRATLVGMPTFGKGAIQYPLRLDWLDEKDPETGKPKSNKTGTVRLTIAKLIAPRGDTINGVGISPNHLEADPTAQLEVALQKAVDAIPMSPSRPVMPMTPPIMP